MALDDYGALIQSGAQLVPDLSKQLMQRVQLGVLGAQAQEYQAQAEAKRQQVARQQQFQQAIQTGDGSASSIASIMRSFPEYADQLKASHDLQSGAVQQADLTATSEIYSAAKSGDWDLAKKLAHQRADAEKARGFSDPSYDAALGVLDKAADGDGGSQRTVLNLLGTHIAAVTGIEHFGSVYGDLNKDESYTLDAGAAHFHNGQMDAHSPFIKDADGNIRLWNDDGSGATPPSSSTPAAGGFDNAVAHVLNHEGGYNPADLNGAPVNFGINAKANAANLKRLGVGDIKNLTRDQAVQIYKGYWDDSGAANLPANMQSPYFDVYVRSPGAAKHALAQSGGDPQQFMQLSSAYFQGLASRNPKAQKYAKAWANRDADNLAIATGSASPQVAAPAQAAASEATGKFPIIIPGKAKDAPSGYQWGADGKTLTPIPGGPADKGSTGGGAPSSQELDDAATQYLLTGQMPALGNGGAGLKQQILGRRSELMKKLGITAEQLPGFQAQYKSDQVALTQNGNLLSALQTSEHALHSNAQQVWNTHRQLVTDGIISDNPWLTRRRLDYYYNFGSPDQKADVKAYRDAVQGYTSEYTKFMTAANGQGGSAAPSDAASSRAGALNDEGMAATPLLAHLRQGMTEAANKRAGAEQQQAALQHRLTNYLHPYAKSGGAAKPAYPVNIPAGAVQMLKSNPTPQMRQFFEQKYGPGLAKQILGK